MIAHLKFVSPPQSYFSFTTFYIGGMKGADEEKIKANPSESPHSGRFNLAHGARRCEKVNGCHPERSEGSRQLLFAQILTKNCRDASLRSA
jgi:hypothetical protein